MDNTFCNDIKNESMEQKTKMVSPTTVSMNSSLYSPDDSGVQFLPTESDLTSSVMSASGMSSDILDMDQYSKNSTEVTNQKEYDQVDQNNVKNEILNEYDEYKQNKDNHEQLDLSHINPFYVDILKTNPDNYMTAHNFMDADNSDVIEMENPIQTNMVQSMESDLMNVSLTSYELLDYTAQNTTIPPIQDNIMNVSMSEEVNENLRLNLEGSVAKIEENIEETIPQEVIAPEKTVEDQIVFRRQRKKKLKSDTPKKRVSFHEDILNSTKVDDVHINHGFITHDDDVSLNFFQKGFLMKSDVVKGRYSWAAEGDTPFYEKPQTDRKVTSDIFVQNRKCSSNSSSSGGSITSSIDEEDNLEENLPVSPPSNSKPKSSCLKKTPHKKILDTKIVHEEINVPKRKSETNLLDSNLFGSLKNMLNFSTSVPLAERGVPEGQEDLLVQSYSDANYSRRRSCTNFSFLNSDGLMVAEENAVPILPLTKKVGNLNLEIAKSNLKLTRNEGFYPNHHLNQELPANVIICDSNVYEHKGISYSYEYENFQKSFEQPAKKSSTLYQRILKEFNFFKKKAMENSNFDQVDDFEIVDSSEPAKNDEEIKINNDKSTRSAVNKYASSTKLDWSDNDTEYSEISSRHLNSPKRKINKSNHYSLQNSLKSCGKYSHKLNEENVLTSSNQLNGKNSLINRFLKNVTMKKMLDNKYTKKTINCSRRSGLYIKHFKKNLYKNDELDRKLELDILSALKIKKEESEKTKLDPKLVSLFRNQLFRDGAEIFIRMFRVRNAYTIKGESQPLLAILTDLTLYISSSSTSNTFTNLFVLPYTELDTILLGPNLQTILFSNRDRDMQCIISTGCRNVANDFMTTLEIAMRQCKYKPRLAAVRYLDLYDLCSLRKAICCQTAVDKDEEYLYYSIVDIRDNNPDFMAENSLINPQKEGPLMFKIQTSSRWETGYFILKAGVLYLLSSPSLKSPLRTFSLLDGACQGARRLANSPRPHTFQLMLDGKMLLLAAPDEYVASDWLQALIHAASGKSNKSEQVITQSCSLIITTGHILTVREIFPGSIKGEVSKNPQTLSCAAIGELVSFRLPSIEQSWCILEFACREVHECSGDWILYFATNAELENFISTLELLWEYNCRNGESFPLSTIPETDPLNKKCSEVYKSLGNSWSINLVHLQFL